MADTVETAVYRLRVEGQAEIDRLTKSVDGLAVAEEKATSSTRTFSQSLQNQVARIDPLVRAQEQYRKALETNARYRESGAGTEAQLNAQLSAATQNYQRQVTAIQAAEKATVSHTNVVKLQRHELVNLSRQAQDIGVSLFSGQSPLTVLIQQGTQVADVFANSQGTVRGFFGQMAAGARAFITPMNAAIAAIVAGTAATAALALQWDKVQVSSQRAISGAGARTGTTVSDINAFVGQNAGVRGTGLSEKEARLLAEEMTRTGDIVIGKLRGMSDAVVGFSNQTGKSVDEAIKAFAQMGKDPVKAMDELAGAYGEFDATTRKTVETLTLAGDKTGAFQVILDSLSEQSKEAAKNMGFFEKVTRGVVNLLATETVKPSGLEAQLAAAQERLSNFQPSGRRGSADLRQMQKEVQDLQAQVDKFNAARITAEFNKANTEAARHGEYVAAIAKSWGDVSVATAQALHAAQQQLPVIQAVTEAERMAAQYAADYNAALVAGKAPADALALAASNLEASHAAANAAIDKEVKALERATELTKAQAKGTGASVEAAQAYDRAIESGADETRAAALQAATLANAMARAASNARSWASIMGSGFNAGMSNLLPMGTGDGRGWVQDEADPDPDAWGNSGPRGSISTDPMANTVSIFYKGGGTGKRIGGFGASGAGMGAFNPAPNTSDAQAIAAADQATHDEAMQGLQDMITAMDDLAKSTDSLNATNQELLSPYYTMDPRTSHIGFRSQGMASGGYVDVPGGVSTNDNMIASIPVASGERIYVDPMTSRRGGSGGGITVNISSPVTINGNANVDQFARTLFQSNQMLAKQVRQAL